MRKPRDFVPPRIGTERDPDMRTHGGKIAAVSAQMGAPLMPHQRYVMDIAYEYDDDGLRYDEVVWTIMRQSGKTTGVRAKKVWRCSAGQYLFGDRQIGLYLAQTRGAARRKLERDFAEGLRQATEFREVKNPRLRPQSPNEWKLSMNNGQENIVFGPGNVGGNSYLQIDAPNRESGHGDTIDDATIDEAFSHQNNDVEEAVGPTQRTRKSAQIWVISTAGDEKSNYFWPKVRDGRRMVQEGRRSRTAYLEWSVPDDADIGDEDVWWEFMPALGRTIDLSTMRSGYEKAMARDDENGEDQFRRADCNQWVRIPIIGSDGSQRVVAEEVWGARVNKQAQLVMDDLVLGIDRSPEHRTITLSVVGTAADGRRHVEIVHQQRNIAELETVLESMCDRYAPVAIAWDHGGPAREVEPAVLRMSNAFPNIALKRLQGSEWSAACRYFLEAIIDNRLSHYDQDWLNHAIAGAKQKQRGDRWVWDRLAPSSDISPLCASTAALWGCESHQKGGEYFAI